MIFCMEWLKCWFDIPIIKSDIFKIYVTNFTLDLYLTEK